MREILSIHIGQCGNQIADQFWRLALAEHGLKPDGTPDNSVETETSSVFFEQERDGRCVPRAILVDLEPGVISRIESGDMRGLFDPSNIVKKLPGAANNWAYGYHAEGQRTIDQILNVIDAAVEKTDSLQGFLITHSIGGGSGSGLGSLIVERLKQAYPKKKLFTFSVAPSALISDSAIEPYNAILSLQKLRQHADISVVLDNEALFRICKASLDRSPTYMDLNRVVGLIMSSVTASLRFPGDLNTDLGEFIVNLVPFPGNHFLTASFAPLRVGGSSPVRTSFSDVAEGTFSRQNFTAAIDYESGVYLAACALFRGRVTAQEVDGAMAQIRSTLNFAPYVPTGIKLGTAKVAPPGFETSGLAIVNHTGISQVFDRLVSQFDLMFAHQAYTHWYEAHGVTLDDLQNARDEVAELSQSYREAAV